MLKRARILIVEDDALWIQTLTDVLTPLAGYLVTTSTLNEAIRLLEHSYFNLAIVDISLDDGNGADTQGMQLLRYLRESGLEKALGVVMFSAYGDVARVNQAYRDFHVADFLDKATFSAEGLVDAVARALAINALAHEPIIEISKKRRIPDLWQRFKWSEREDPAQLEPELTDLLYRLFPDAVHLFVDDMATGQSGAGVLRVMPAYRKGVGTPVVVKFGKRDKIEQERQNFVDHIEHYIGSHSSTQLTAASARVLAAITYRLIGTELDDVKSFARFYALNDVKMIEHALDNLFHVTCKRWYQNLEQPRLMRDLVSLYEDGLHIDWNEVWDGVAECGLDLTKSPLYFPGISGSYPNPRDWLEERNSEIYMQVWRAITHGDLNQSNILVTNDARCWLIDFYRTGLNHILRDVIELETAIKFALVTASSLADYAQFEEYLLKQMRLDELALPNAAHPFYKPLAIIGYLRKTAYTLAGGEQNTREYEVGLLLTTLNLLRLDFLCDHHQKVVLSAAMLCDKLSAQP